MGVRLQDGGDLNLPYNPAQNKLFRAAEHDSAIAKDSGIPQATAKKLAHEGVTKQKPVDPKKLAKALMGMK